MLIHLIAYGKIGRSAEAELVNRYEKRIRWPLQITELPENAGRSALTTGAVQKPLRTVLLDEEGDQLSSQEFANMLESWRNDGVREARFLIGAADGHTADERAEADKLIAFGRVTWPHLLVRAMLMEQLYRATTILSGHPYHRS